MRPIPISRYIWLGLAIRFLEDAGERLPIKTPNFVLDNINRVFDAFEEHSLPVSMRACTQLQDFKKEIEEKDEDARLSKNEAVKLDQIMRMLRSTVMAEASGVYSFVINEKRFPADRLINDIKSLMSVNVFDSMPIIAQEDFKEAGKCIAFERSTAAAFHLLRGTEGCLRQFYRNVVRRDRIDPLLWGPMTKHLGKRKGNFDDAIHQLDIIRRNYRNPTQHPEKSYDVDEAQNLFGLCIQAVEFMVRHEKYERPN